VKVWFEPILPEIQKLKSLSDSPEADSEGLKEYESTLRSLGTLSGTETPSVSRVTIICLAQTKPPQPGEKV
jgi:hypothetical protein